MKTIISCIIIFTVGLLLGGLGPRSDLRNLEKEISKLQEKLKDCNGKSSPMLGEVTRMLGVQKPGRNSAPKVPRPRTTPLPTVEPSDDTGVVTEFQWEDDDPFADTEDMESALDAASDLFDIRRQQAMEILINELNLSPDEIADFEAAMSDMNDDIEEQIQDFVDGISDEMNPSPEDALALAHDLSGTLLGSYDRMDEIFPEDWREDASPDTSPINFIDPRVALPILKIEEEMASREGYYED